MVCTKRPSDADYPNFGEVSHILVHEEAKYLVLKRYVTLDFSQHYFAYHIESSEDSMLLCICDLAMHQVFHKYHVDSRSYVVIRSCDHVELLI